ncbi:MAG: PASTA domain-containing protein [Dysgonomonas sp.]|nr:PASTA domain-containing protein [Dysgonomonas sp.]
MKKDNIVLRFFKNIYVRNIALMIIIFLALVAIVLVTLTFYTRHNEAINVPAVKGLQMEDASSIINAADLKYEVIDSMYQTGGVPGAIIEQIPKENSKVKKGRTIYLKVQAKGVQMVAIPDLKDYSRRQAEGQLNSLGFDKITIEEVTSPYKGLVVSLSYKGRMLTPGQKIPKGAPLKMVVGAGGEEIDDSIPEIETNQNIENSFFE